MQDGVHLLSDRHFDTASVSKADGCSRGEDTLRDHSMHSGDDLRKFSASAEFYSYRSVARKPTGAGKNQIAQASESRHSFGAASAGNHKPRHFGESTGD